MTEKFTLRDFMVYFLTGFFLFLTILFRYNSSLLQFFNIEKVDIENNSALTILILVPGLYLLGHFIHSVDWILFKIGRFVIDIEVTYKKKHNNCFFLCIIKMFRFITSGSRISGIVYTNSKDSKMFWQKVAKLQSESKYDRSEYWYLINDLFKGITLIALGWVFYSLIIRDFVSFFIYFVLTILCWFRARHSATNFVTTIENTCKEIESKIN